VFLKKAFKVILIFPNLSNFINARKSKVSFLFLQKAVVRTNVKQTQRLLTLEIKILLIWATFWLNEKNNEIWRRYIFTPQRVIHDLRFTFRWMWTWSPAKWMLWRCGPSSNKICESFSNPKESFLHDSLIREYLFENYVVTFWNNDDYR
jgi:hypothetical protein